MQIQEIQCPECGARFWIGQDHSGDFEPLTRCAACGAEISEAYDWEDEEDDWVEEDEENWSPCEEEEWNAWEDGGLYDRRPSDERGELP